MEIEFNFKIFGVLFSLTIWIEIKMQTSARNEAPTKTPPKKGPSKKSRKLFKLRFVSETSLHNVRRDQIFFYILTLHKKIRSLLAKCKRYREKILKLVSNVLKFLGYFETIIVIYVNCFAYFQGKCCSKEFIDARESINGWKYRCSTEWHWIKYK